MGVNTLADEINEVREKRPGTHYDVIKFLENNNVFMTITAKLSPTTLRTLYRQKAKELEGNKHSSSKSPKRSTKTSPKSPVTSPTATPQPLVTSKVVCFFIRNRNEEKED